MTTKANLFSGIKNGFLAKNSKIIQQYSKQSIIILNILLREGFIKDFKIEKKKIIIYLKYKQNKSVINKIKYITKNNKSIYIKNQNIYKKRKDFFLILTTGGLLTIYEAKKYNIGGKLLCKIN